MIRQPIIDAHVHLWDPTRNDDILILKEQPWLAPSGNADALSQHISESGATGALIVQSAPSNEHSDWLRSSARAIGGTLGVVAWLDPNSKDAMARAEVLIDDPLVCGIRLMLNRMENPSQILQAEALICFNKLISEGIVIECLSPPAHLQTVGALAKALSQGHIVLDHCGLPPGPQEALEYWYKDLKALSRFPNISCKFSGFIEPFGPTVKCADIESRALSCLDLFSPQRLMAASNFPVCDMGGGSKNWRNILGQILQKAGLSSSELFEITAGTAWRVFHRYQYAEA